MAFQKLLGHLLLSSSICVLSIWRLSPAATYSWALLYLAFFVIFILQVVLALIYTIIIHPHISSIRHLPKAPQAPLRKRLFKEPCAYHFEKWINEVPNDGLIRYFGMLNMERVLLTSPAAVRQVLQVDAYSYEKQHAQKTHLERVSGRGLVFQEGNIHKFQRKAMDPAFRWGVVKRAFYPLIWKKTAHMLSLLDHDNKDLSCSPRPSKSANVIGVDEIVHRTVFDIIGLVSYGIDFESIGRPDALFGPLKYYREAFEPSPSNRLRVYLAFVLPTWTVNALPIRFNFTTAIGVRQFRTIGKDFIARRQLDQKSKDIEQNGISSAIIDSIIESGKLSDKEVLEQFSMLQAGGIHTTAAAILSVIWHLAQTTNSNIQANLREEIRRELPSPEISSIGPKQLDKCPYLKAVINEVLRLHPPFSWFGRTPNRKSEVCGIILPKGLSISLSPWALHRRKELWGTDAFDFKPERWLQTENGCSVPKDSFGWLTFGTGPRRCIGEKLARAELECLIAGLFGRFKVSFSGDQELPRVTHQVTLAFKEELRVRLARLDGW